MKPLFICLGNLMRSQMAEGFYNHLTHTKDAMSAGVSPFTPTSHSAPDLHAIMAMDELGIDIATQRVKIVTQDMVNQSDAIYSMVEDYMLPEYVKNSPKLTYWPVDDPYGQPKKAVDEARDKIKALVEGVVEGVGGK